MQVRQGLGAAFLFGALLGLPPDGSAQSEGDLLPISGPLSLGWEIDWPEVGSSPRLSLTLETSQDYEWPSSLEAVMTLEGRILTIRVAGVRFRPDRHFLGERHPIRAVLPMPALADSGHHSLRIVYGDQESTHLLTMMPDGFEVTPIAGDAATTDVRRVRLDEPGQVAVYCSSGRLERAFCREFYSKTTASVALPGVMQQIGAPDGASVLWLRTTIDTLGLHVMSAEGTEALHVWMNAAEEYSAFFPEVSFRFDAWDGSRVLCTDGACGARTKRPRVAL